MTNDEASKGSMIMKAGGIAGAPVVGWISQTLGRRRAIVLCGVMICLLIPFWIMPDSPLVLFTGGFFFIFLCVQVKQVR
jgi:sugar phosphate permease